MDLRYFAGQVLIKTEIGKNLSQLPAKLNKLNLVNESVTIGKLLAFNENSVENLYRFDPVHNTFKLEHTDGDYLARASAVLNPLGVRFRAEFVEENRTEFGISYVGIIRILHLTEHFDIKVPGELSYDPACIAGDKLWVEYHQVNKIVIFVVVLVKSALLGATKKFLKRLYVVIKPIIARYYQKEELFRWMYKQVKYACVYKKQPMSYAEHLKKAEMRHGGTVQSYLASLEQLKRGEIQEILPPPEFFRALTEVSYSEKSSQSKISEFLDGKIQSYTENDEYPGIPTIQEIKDSLTRINTKYEKELTAVLKKVQTLHKETSEKIEISVSFNLPFTSQCPIF